MLHSMWRCRGEKVSPSWISRLSELEGKLESMALHPTQLDRLLSCLHTNMSNIDKHDGDFRPTWLDAQCTTKRDLVVIIFLGYHFVPRVNGPPPIYITETAFGSTSSRRSTTLFPMSPRWTSYVVPKTPKGWLKKAKCAKFEQKSR